MSDLQVSDLQDYDKEPMPAGASSMYLSKEVEQLKKDNHRLTVRVEELEVTNKKLSEAVDHFDEEKGELQCQIDDLTKKLHDSSSSESKAAAKDVPPKDTDTGDEEEIFHSLATESIDGTDRRPVSAANASFTGRQNDLQLLGQKAEQQHSLSHRKENKLTAEAVRTQETVSREGDSQLTRTLALHKETPKSIKEESKKLQEAEDRVQQLQAELNMMKKEKIDFEHKVAEVRDECEKTKRKVLVDAEKDKKLLIEESEHCRRTNESLQLQLSHNDGTIRQLTEELRTMRELYDAMNDESEVKRDSTENEDTNSSSSVSVGEANTKVDSPNPSICTLEGKHSDELEAMREALEESRELERKTKQELTESAQQFKTERESQKEMVRRLEQQHQDKVAELKAKVKDAADMERRSRANSQAVLQQKEEDLKQVNKKLRNASQEIGNLQATAEGLRSQIATMHTALAEAREENTARIDHEAKLTSHFQGEVASRDANIRQLEEKCEQLDAQATVFKSDFDQERSDRQEAMGRFEGEREAFQETIENLNEKMKAMHLEHDATVAQLEQLKETSVQNKMELKEKEEMLQHTRGSCTGLEQKLTKLHSQHDTLSKENAALRAQLKTKEKDIKAFKAIEEAYQKTFDEAKTYKDMYRDAESKRSAAASRVNELTMVVNAMEAKGHADAAENVETLKEEYQRMRRQYDSLEASCKRVTSEKQQLAFAYQELQILYGSLQRENEALKNERIVTPATEMSLAARSPQNGQFWSLQSSVGAGGGLRKDGNGAKGDIVGGHFAGDHVERDSPPGSSIGKAGPSSSELISVGPTSLPRPRAPLPEGMYRNAGRGTHPGLDPRMAKGYPAAPRVNPQPVVGMSEVTAESHMQQPLAKHRDAPLAQANMYAPSAAVKFSTDPNISSSAESSLPNPLTRPGAAASLDDSFIGDFEANQRYIGEGINTEIRQEARRYKKSEKGVVAAPAQADDKEWPLDPNLTCPYCHVVFRRGQMREYRYHVDECPRNV